MTSEEAINVLLENVPKCCKMVDGRYQGGFDNWDCDMGQAIRVAVLVLQDVRNYRKIGTVEEVMQNARDLKRQTEHSEHLAEVLKATQNLLEKRERLLKEYCKIGTVEKCREAVEKQKAKAVKNRKLLKDFHGSPYCIQGDCPNCGCKSIKATATDYCYVCGQHLKWNENLEGMEDE